MYSETESVDNSALHTCTYLLYIQLVMASDKLGAIQKPVLNLDLDIVENGKQRMESIELNQHELERFISSLEAANKVIGSESRVIVMY